MINETLEVMVGRIDERTARIEKDIQGIKTDCTDLYNRANQMKSQLDTLQAEHNDRKSINDCPLPIPSSGISPKLIAQVGSVSGGVSVILLIILLLILKAMGFSF